MPSELVLFACRHAVAKSGSSERVESASFESASQPAPSSPFNLLRPSRAFLRAPAEVPRAGSASADAAARVRGCAVYSHAAHYCDGVLLLADGRAHEPDRLVVCAADACVPPAAATAALARPPPPAMPVVVTTDYLCRVVAVERATSEPSCHVMPCDV